MSHGFPAGVTAVCIPVLLALCHVVLKVYNHRHVKKTLLALLNVATTRPKVGLLK